MEKTAEISASGRYRYTLGRVWDIANPKRMIFIMLNPSTADHEEDDPTIRRCIGFAKREGMGGMVVINLFSYRTPSPAELAEKGWPVGPGNDNAIRRVLRDMPRGSIVVCGWGSNGAERPVADRVTQVLELLAAHGVDAQCLGLTKTLHPSHPLYLRKDAPLIPLP